MGIRMVASNSVRWTFAAVVQPWFRSGVARRRMYSIVSLLALMLIGGGCQHGVIAFPFVDMQYLERENGMGKAIRVKAWGLCLLTHPQDAGLILGSVNRTYYFNDETRSGVEDVITHLAEASSEFSMTTTEPFAWSGLDPVALTSRDIGLMLHANPHRIGFTIGLSSRALVVLPREFRGAMYIHAQVGEDTPPSFAIVEEITP